MFTTLDAPGSLNDALLLFRKHGVNLTRIESRPAKRGGSCDFIVDFACAPPAGLLEDLRGCTAAHSFLLPTRVAWFPTSIADIDEFSTKTLDAGADLEADHPGFSDATYRTRRYDIVETARSYRHGDAIPSVSYTPQEVETWGVVYRRLKAATQLHAVAAYRDILPSLERECGFAEDNIPQLQDVSRFLQSATGFTLRPVGGLLSARDFLNGLAFRVFFSTQYIRHHSVPLYTPEPDICHELLGHAPMFADPDFAEFSHDIGLASLGASDEDIERLAACYWFSVEFGLCTEGGARKAYGAGLLSSFGEIEYACGAGGGGSNHPPPVFAPWEPSKAAVQPYPITQYQPLYFVADSLADAKVRMRGYCEEKMTRPFRVTYDTATGRVTTDRAVAREGYVR